MKQTQRSASQVLEMVTFKISARSSNARLRLKSGFLFLSAAFSLTLISCASAPVQTAQSDIHEVSRGVAATSDSACGGGSKRLLSCVPNETSQYFSSVEICKKGSDYALLMHTTEKSVGVVGNEAKVVSRSGSTSYEMVEYEGTTANLSMLPNRGSSSLTGKFFYHLGAARGETLVTCSEK